MPSPVRVEPRRRRLAFGGLAPRHAVSNRFAMRMLRRTAPSPCRAVPQSHAAAPYRSITASPESPESPHRPQHEYRRSSRWPHCSNRFS
ncbi:hypothetical protein DO73_5215 [Burkholderia pseudomallei]|nr:hypothetical protein DO73_5215 [Burkholderia pseudomallei]